MAGITFTPLEIERIQRTAKAVQAAQDAYSAPDRPAISWPLVIGLGGLGLLAVAALTKGGR